MSDRPKVVIAVVAVTIFGAIVANIGTEFPFDMGFVQPNGDIPDVVRDWLAVRAIYGDGSPTDSMSDLALIHLGIDLDGGPHPRTPGALLLLLPFSLVAVDWVWPLMTILVIVTAALSVWASVQIVEWAWPWILMLGFSLMLTGPMMAAVLLGSQAPAIAAIAAGSWLAVRRRDSGLAGVLVGVGATLKLFPGLLVPVLWVAHRRRAANVASGVFVGLNLVGLFLPGVSISSAIGSLSPPVESWPNNLALGLPPYAVTVMALAVVWFAKKTTIDAAMALGIAAMLALSPVVWNHYLVILLAPLVWLMDWTIRRIFSGRQSPFASNELGDGRQQ
jgi:hypothetical protein